MEARLFFILTRHRKNQMFSDGNKITSVEYIFLKTLNLKDFLKKNILKVDTETESGFQNVYIYCIYPRDSILYTKKRFTNIKNRQMGGTY